mgnify:CR=1 FL=1
MQAMHALPLAFVVMNAADQLTTYYGLAHGGEEGNPVFRWLFAHIGFGWATVVKMALAVAFWGLFYVACRRWPRAKPAMRNGLVILLVVYLAAVAVNILGA